MRGRIRKRIEYFCIIRESLKDDYNALKCSQENEGTYPVQSSLWCNHRAIQTQLAQLTRGSTLLGSVQFATEPSRTDPARYPGYNYQPQLLGEEQKMKRCLLVAGTWSHR